MPELPEVESVRRALLPRLVGRRIVEVSTSGKPMRMGEPVQADLARRVTGARIEAVDRLGKYLLLRLGEQTLILHLGMSGRLLWCKPGDPIASHTHLRLRLRPAAELRLVDPRRFGVIVARDTATLGDDPMLRKLGPDPLSPSFDGAALHAAFAGRTRNVKDSLLDQRLVAGVGNIYACEALFAAGISPRRPAGRISRRRLDRLAGVLREILLRSIEHGGTTLRDFAAVDGAPGGNQDHLQVFGREGQPCPRCAASIRRLVQGGRSTFCCPRCQAW